MSTYIGKTEIRRSEVLALIAQEVKIAPQGHQEPFGAFSRRIRKEFDSDEEASQVAEYCLARWLARERKDLGPSRPLVRSSPNVEKVQMLAEQKAEEDNIDEDATLASESGEVEEKSSNSITPFDEGHTAAKLSGENLNPYEEHSLIALEWQRGFDSFISDEEE